MSGTWIVPFKGRNHSWAHSQNFLWKSNNVYIMDNHRSALWCWFQHFQKDNKVNFIHIDKHTDTLYSQMNTWLEICPDLWDISIEDYLGIKYEGAFRTQFPLFSWANYASIFMEKYPHLLDTCIFITHGEGDLPKPSQFHFRQSDIFALPANFCYWLEDKDSQWICNVDLDFFFCKLEEDENSLGRLFSDDYFCCLFSSIREQLQRKNILVLTISLSPECCGGWEAAEEICSQACEILEINFKLPES